ncbi:MAG: pyruvate dehydrogenase complex dihydrolipoamide acetyltransferase [Bacteroidota bacterium]
MAIAVEMPKMSDTMEEGVLVAWLAEEGDSVSAGDVIAQVETDKATMDLEVYDDGVLLKKVVEEGSGVPIGGLIAVLGKEGESADDVLAKYGGSGDGAASAAPEPPPASAPVESVAEPTNSVAEPTNGAAAAAPSEGGRVKASPLARKMAAEGGIDLGGLAGSGPEGRIVKKDVEAAMAGAAPVAKAAPVAAPVAQPVAQPVSAPAAAPVTAPSAGTPGAGVSDAKLSQMRKTIARRLAQSKFTAPHFYLTVDIDMEEAMAFRSRINELGAAQNKAKVSFNDLVTKACALALRQHPAINSSYLEDEGVMRTYDEVHVAIAVAIPDGLVTPVVRHADRKGLAEIAADTRELAGKARDRTLQPQDWEGSTFTTSNLGMFGIEQFTAIINPPNACILAIGGIRDEAVVKNGEVVPGKRMKVALSCDHRAVDGATGAEFLNTVKGYLEEPVMMLL